MTVTDQPSVATDVAVDWLSELYGDDAEGWLTLFMVEKATGNRETTWHDLSEPFTLPVERFATCDVWHGVATRKQRLDRGRRGGDADCLAIPGLWLDIDIAGPNHKTTEQLPPDIDAALALVDDYPVPPTAIVHSGGGLQVWWLFGRMVPCDDAAKDLLRRWATTWQTLADRRAFHLDNVFDMARIMRLPGTLNLKTEPTPVRVLERWLP